MTRGAGPGLLVSLCRTGLLSCFSTPRVDVRGEADAIRRLSTEWLAAEVSKDVEGAVAMYADDAVELPSNTPMVVGKEAIRTWYKGWLPDSALSVTFATEDVGKYLTVWKRVGGKWKVLADMNASDQPVAGS
jgi:hypothetical protein